MATSFDKEIEQGKPKLALPRTLSEQPGGLRGETRMTLQTRQAQKLVMGRRKGKEKRMIRGREVTVDIQPIIGLLDFGRRMKLLWLSAQADDPYADWYLLQIEESINEAKTLIREKKTWLDEMLNSMEAFEINIAQSLEPIQVPIVFQNPYGYMGAYLISEYDALCCSIFTAGHIGLIDRRTSAKLTEEAGKSIRRTFNLAGRWKFTGVTRDDISANNPISDNAIKTHGECPDPILAKTKRAKISPEIRTQKNRDNVKQIKAAEEDNNEPENREAVAVSDNLFGMG